MKTIIAGSRGLVREIGMGAILASAVQCGWTIDEVVCGCAVGIDRLGWKWAKDNGIPVRFFPAWHHQHEWAAEVVFGNEVIASIDWAQNASAGYKRNLKMASYGEALIAVWDGLSNGTGNMIKIAEGAGLRVFKQMVKT